MRLAPQTKSQRRALATISAADILAIEQFVDGMKGSGKAKVRGVAFTTTAVQARRLWRAGQGSNNVTFNRATLFFLQSGRPLQYGKIKASADVAVNNALFRIQDAALRLTQGTLQVDDWLTEHNRWTKILHAAESALGRGGFAEMTAADWARAEERIAYQFGFSRKFAERINDGYYGKLGSEGFKENLLLRHASLYTFEGRNTYENTRTENAKDRLGHTHARRILANVDHCKSCEEVAARGWIPIDEYPEQGTDDCRSCQCVTITGIEGNLID